MDLPPDSPAESRPVRRRIAIAVGIVTVLLLGGYAATVAAVSGEVPTGTSVRGVEIGGMTTQEAADLLEQELGAQATAPIPVTAGESDAALDPAESGLAVDWIATASQSSGIILSPVSLMDHLRGDVELDPITTIDDDSLVESLETLAAEVAVEPEEPGIHYTKESVAKLTPSVQGTFLEVPASVEMVSAAYFSAEPQSLVLPMKLVPTMVTDAEARRVFTQLAEPAVARPVTLVVDEERAKVPPADIARTLTFAPDGVTLTGTLDGKALHKRLAADELADIERRGRDAAIRIEDGRPVVVRSVTGQAIAPDDLATAVFAVLPETTASDRRATVTPIVTQPDFTTKEAKALNIKEKLSSFLQHFPPAEYRYINVGEAARRLNGTILEPGDEFSMNDTLKERTAANGYTEGFVIEGGRFREELGGGVSIITTATWTAGFYAGLERVEQHPHGLYISRYQAGLEATVAWGLLDLRMRNATGNGVLITATRYNDGVLIEMWGTKKWDDVTSAFTERRNYTNFQTIYDDGERCVPSEGSRGFSIAVTRRRIVDGESTSTETWPTTYKPTPNVVCAPTP